MNDTGAVKEDARPPGPRYAFDDVFGYLGLVRLRSPISRVTSRFDRWESGLLSELAAFGLFIGGLFILSVVIVWLL